MYNMGEGAGATMATIKHNPTSASLQIGNLLGRSGVQFGDCCRDVMCTCSSVMVYASLFGGFELELLWVY